MWDYAEASRIVTLESVASDTCIFCQRELVRIPSERFEAGTKVLLAQVSVCPACGWWSVYRVHQNEYERTAGLAEGYSGTIGCLKELDLADLSVPLSEVRQYFLAKKDSMVDAHPRLFEEVVASVFSALGWTTRVTAYSGDDGIDVVLDGPEDKTVGVQVKRNRPTRSIEAEQIRSFAGALLLNGLTRGVFVTTSKFRKGARRAATKYEAIGLPIQLLDAEGFLSALGVAQVSSFELTGERLASLILRPNVHIGSGEHKEYTPGEDLRDRPVLTQTFTRDEWQ